jgi:hypothetical protein
LEVKMNPSGESRVHAVATPQRWGAIASLLIVVALIVASGIYLTGDINTVLGVIGYSVADLLFGPVLGASLVSVIAALRERFGQHAPIRMSYANTAAILAAGAFVVMACIRASNRQYFLESSRSDLVAWTTIVAGVNGAAWHFLGWMFVLVGWSGWTSRLLPRVLSALLLVGGAASLFVYQWGDEVEGFARLFALLVSLWLGILLWTARSDTG